MSGKVQAAPPHRIATHLHVAFSGVFGALNLFVGAVSIFRQIARAFDVGLSPVLKGVFAAYVQIFHGFVDFFAQVFSWLLGLDLTVPAWAHDWIILWFVMAGAAARVVVGTQRLLAHADTEGWRQVPTGPMGIIYRLSHRVGLVVFGLRGGFEAMILAEGISAYLLALVLWPLVLLQLLLEPKGTVSFYGEITDVAVNLLAIFVLQTLAIILAIFGLSVLNAQTM